MELQIVNNNYVYMNNIIDRHNNILWDKMTFVDPNSKFMNKNRPWQGKFRKYDLVQKRCLLTFLPRIVHICKSENLPFSIDDIRDKWNYPVADPNTITADYLPKITLEDYQIAAIKKAIQLEFGIFKLTTGAGKCLGKDTPVMMFDGSVKMVQDIRVGELLMGDDSTPRQVLSTCKGKENLYRIDQIYGDSYVVNESHILSLIKTPAKKGQIHQKIDINVVDYLNSTDYEKHRLKGYKVSVDYPYKNVELDPYFLGLWLGDGISADTSFCLHEEDASEVIESLYEYARSLGCVIHTYNEPSKANNYAIRLYEGVHAPSDYVAFTENPFRKSLKYYNLLNNKHIPDDYIFNDREIRLQLLAGIIDSDGEFNNNGYFVNLKNRDIVEKCCIIARSLGFRSNVTPNKKRSQTGYEGQYWKLSIWGHTDIIPVKTSYKKASPRSINKNPLVYGIELTELGEGDYYGFEIDGNKRFLLGDFTVTHNTEIIAGICKAINCPTVILADMTVVVSQLKERLQLRNVAEEIGLFFAGEKPNGEMIVVGSVQSLAAPTPVGPSPSTEEFPDDNKYQKALQKWHQQRDAYNTRKKNYKFLIEYVQKAEMLIVDECVDEDSFVHTSNGLCTAKSVYDKVIRGEKVYINSLNSSNLILGASAKYDNNIEIVTSRNRSLKTSENHKFAVFTNGYRTDKYASDILPGDLLLVNNNDYNITTNWHDDFTWLWYFVGLFIGDGHLLNGRQIKFGVRKDHDDWIDAITKVSNLFGCDFRHSFNNRGDLVLRLKSYVIAQFLKSLGFSKGRKMGSIDPKFDVEDEFVCALLRGLFDSEGTAYSDCCHFDSADLKLSKYVQNALAYIGIPSNLFISNHRKSTKHAKCWRVSITAANYNKFIRLVGFGFNRKSSRTIGSTSFSPNRFIDPKYYINKWLKFIPLKIIKKTLQRNDFASNVSLQTLIEWQSKIVELSQEHVDSYELAKNIYSISYDKISRFEGRSTMTIFNLIKNGSDVWKNYVNFIKKQLSIAIIDDKLIGYSVEPVKECLKSDEKIRLIDFAVENINSFDVNGFLVHNCDRSASDTYKKVIRTHFKGRRKYGFSATPYDDAKPIKNINVEENFGPIVFEMNRKEVEERGRIIPCKYRSIVYEDPNFDLHNKITLDEATNMFMIENQRFHDIIFGICNVHKGERNMILTERIPLGENLLARAQTLGLNARFIYGSTPKSERDRIIAEFAAGQLDVLIGGKIVNRGLDIKGGVDNLIVATGGKLRSDFLQKIGRALRVNNRGFSYVYDFLFRCNHYLYEHSKARLATIIDAGYESKVLFGYANLDGKEFVRRNYQPPARSRSGRGRETQKTLFHQRDCGMEAD